MGLRSLVVSLWAVSVTASLVVAQTNGQQGVVRIPDGGAGGRMQSIFIPPKAGAPFSFVLATEWSRPMANGGRFTLANERHIVRDSKGRIYQERWILVPKGSNIQSHMDVFQITDPELHTWLNCETATKVCDLYYYHLTTDQKFLAAIIPAGSLPNGGGFRQNEDLGLGSVEGQETHGYRETVTVNTGVMGNDKPMVTTREFWYSPHLAVNLISVVDTPQSGKQVFTAKEISTAEPDAGFFNVPADYKVVDRRNESN